MKTAAKKKVSFVEPKPFPKLEVGKTYEFVALTKDGKADLRIREIEMIGRVVEEFRYFYLVLVTKGYCTTIHKASIGLDWRVRRVK